MSNLTNTLSGDATATQSGFCTLSKSKLVGSDDLQQTLTTYVYATPGSNATIAHPVGEYLYWTSETSVPYFRRMGKDGQSTQIGTYSFTGYPRCLVYSNGVWSYRRYNDTTGAYSTDGGLTFNPSTGTTVTWGNSYGAAVGNGKVIRISNAAVVEVSSDDGISWSNSSYGGGITPMGRFIFGNGIFAFCSSDKFVYSTDGSTWNSTDLSAFANDFRSVAYGNGVWIVLNAGSSGSVIALSTDNGVTFSSVANNRAVGNPFIVDVTYWDGCFWSCINDGYNWIQKSIDGKSWSYVLTASGSIKKDRTGMWGTSTALVGMSTNGTTVLTHMTKRTITE